MSVDDVDGPNSAEQARQSPNRQRIGQTYFSRHRQRLQPRKPRLLKLPDVLGFEPYRRVHGEHFMPPRAQSARKISEMATGTTSGLDREHDLQWLCSRTTLGFDAA